MKTFTEELAEFKKTNQALQEVSAALLVKMKSKKSKSPKKSYASYLNPLDPSPCVVDEEDIDDVLIQLVSNLTDRLSYLETSFYDYISEGRLPKLNASALQKLLDVAGVGEDYQIYKPYVSAAKFTITK